MFIIIINIQVIKNGILLVNLRCGNFIFHIPDFNDLNLASIGTEGEAAAFLAVLNSFSEKIIGSSIKYIKFQNFIFHFYKDISRSNLLFIIITDINSNPEELRLKLKKIASIFNEKFSSNLYQFNGNVGAFQNFGELLAEI